MALCVTGSIAAFKAVLVARLLKQLGAKVLVVMTRSSERFVGAVTFSGITGERVYRDMWDPDLEGEPHVDIASRADVIAVVPATADILARMAHGRADDLVAALLLVAKGPVLVAPAMHPRMWAHPATQKNVATVRSVAEFIGPVVGEVASGEFGLGRMAEPQEIVAAISTLLGAIPSPASPVRDLDGVRLVVTAGPTVEDLDPVRFLTNRSSGKMGFAVARRASERGADVTLIAGPVALETPAGVKRVDVRGTMEMQSALALALGDDLKAADALIMAAAVADYRPASVSGEKTKKEGERMSIEFVRNPDLLAAIGGARTGRLPYLVGFAVETGSPEALLAYARGKLERKRVDLIVVNEATQAFGGNDNEAVLVSETAAVSVPRTTKEALSDRILDRVVAGLLERA